MPDLVVAVVPAVLVVMDLLQVVELVVSEDKHQQHSETQHLLQGQLVED